MTMTTSNKYSTLILFQAKSQSGSSITDRLSQKWKFYHLAEKFNTDHDTIRTLCGAIHYINWGSEFVIITKDEIQKIKAAGKNPDIFCEKCVSIAMILRDIEEEKPEEEKNNKKKRKNHY
jgi:hypothetical protein